MTFLFAQQNVEGGLIAPPPPRPAFSITRKMFRTQFILHQVNISKVTAGSDAGGAEKNPKTKGKKAPNRGEKTPNKPLPPPPALFWDRTERFVLHSAGLAAALAVALCAGTATCCCC